MWYDKKLQSESPSSFQFSNRLYDILCISDQTSFYVESFSRNLLYLANSELCKNIDNFPNNSIHIPQILKGTRLSCTSYSMPITPLLLSLKQ